MGLSHRAFAVGVLVLQLACTQGVPGPDLTAERALLLEADLEYVEAANAGEVEALAGLYASDAKRYSPAGPITVGTDAMRAFAEGVASTSGFHLTPLGEPTVQIAASGDMAYTLNELELVTSDPDGSPVAQRLRDLHIWRREAGGWKIVEDLWQTLP